MPVPFISFLAFPSTAFIPSPSPSLQPSLTLHSPHHLYPLFYFLPSALSTGHPSGAASLLPSGQTLQTRSSHDRQDIHATQITTKVRSIPSHELSYVSSIPLSSNHSPIPSLFSDYTCFLSHSLSFPLISLVYIPIFVLF